MVEREAVVDRPQLRCHQIGRERLKAADSVVRCRQTPQRGRRWGHRYQGTAVRHGSVGADLGADLEAVALRRIVVIDKFPAGTVERLHGHVPGLLPHELQHPRHVQHAERQGLLEGHLLVIRRLVDLRPHRQRRHVLDGRGVAQCDLKVLQLELGVAEATHAGVATQQRAGLGRHLRERPEHGLRRHRFADGVYDHVAARDGRVVRRVEVEQFLCVGRDAVKPQAGLHRQVVARRDAPHCELRGPPLYDVDPHVPGRGVLLERLVQPCVVRAVLRVPGVVLAGRGLARRRAVPRHGFGEEPELHRVGVAHKQGQHGVLLGAQQPVCLGQVHADDPVDVLLR
eukprot:PhM_4_TR11454/c0_g1_i1/m.85361